MWFRAERRELLAGSHGRSGAGAGAAGEMQVPAGRGAPNALQHKFVFQTARPGSLCVCTQTLAVLKGTEHLYFFLSLNKAFQFIFNIK